MRRADQFKYLRLEGTRKELRVSFVNSDILAADVIQGIGRELMQAADMASRIDMPLELSFQGVENISSALIGKLVLLNRKAKTVGIKWNMSDMSPPVLEIFRRLF